MQSKHRRVPSAMPSQIFEDELDELPNYMPLSIPTSISRIQLLAKETKAPKNNLSPFISASTNPTSTFSNYNNFHAHEFCGSSNTSEKKDPMAKELIEDTIKIIDFVDENPFSDLAEAVDQILKSRNLQLAKIHSNKKNIKKKLKEIFNFAVERRNQEDNGSQGTIEAPSNSFYADDFSLVKFDPSIDQDKKKLRNLN
jgi:hypothetical protein